MTAHWVFSAQYLKTSLVLPRLLSEAKIEFDEEDATQENRVSNRSSGIASYNLLKQMAAAIEHEKKLLKHINLKLLMFNLLMALFIVAQFVVETLSVITKSEILNFDIESTFAALVQVFTVGILAYAATRIRKAIKAINITLPNERLINIHVANSVIYTILWLGLGICLIPLFSFIQNQQALLRLLVLVNILQNLV